MAALLLAMTAEAAAPPSGPLTKCADDAVVAGTVCMDKYEASAWRVPNPTTTNKKLVTKIQNGKATVGDLGLGGATQVGLYAGDYAPCAVNGLNCANDVFAVSLPDVTPSGSTSWFQAQQACTNAGKRLPSNAEWQAAVAGTPDPGPDNGTTDCNTGSTFAVAPTGSRSACVSARGAFDMVGNQYEWVAEWVPQSTTCGAWNPGVSPTNDFQCLAGATTAGEPGALQRGGSFANGTNAGPLAVHGSSGPSIYLPTNFGFRCAR